MSVTPPTDGHKVYISNREIYDMVVVMQRKLTTLTTINGIVMAVITFLTIEGLK